MCYLFSCLSFVIPDMLIYYIILIVYIYTIMKCTLYSYIFQLWLVRSFHFLLLHTFYAWVEQSDCWGFSSFSASLIKRAKLAFHYQVEIYQRTCCLWHHGDSSKWHRMLSNFLLWSSNRKWLPKRQCYKINFMKVVLAHPYSKDDTMK